MVKGLKLGSALVVKGLKLDSALVVKGLNLALPCKGLKTCRLSEEGLKFGSALVYRA